MTQTMEGCTTESLALPVLGMTCAACQHHVEKALQQTVGVKSAHVDLMANRASVVLDPALTRPENLTEAIRKAGYDAVIPHAGERVTQQKPKSSRSEAGVKAWVTLAAGAAAMLLAMPLGTEMGTLDYWLMRFLPWLYQVPVETLRWPLLALTGVLIAWAGR